MTAPRDPGLPELDRAIRAAAARGDATELADLYALAAAVTRDPDAAAFLRTQAYVFALEAGHPLAAALHAALRRAGRDA